MRSTDWLACFVCADPTASTECSLPPCGGGSGRGVAAEEVFDRSAFSTEASATHRRTNRSSSWLGTPLPDPPPLGGRELKALLRAVCGPAISRCAPEPQFFRLHAKGGVGRGDDHAAAREMITYQRGKQVLTGGVERTGRFVQQPDRPPHREQPGDREPPPLSGRQIGRRQMHGMIEPHRGEAFMSIERLAAQKIPPER